MKASSFGRVHLAMCVVFILAVGCTGNDASAHGPTGKSSPRSATARASESWRPSPSGPVITVADDPHPYTVQGVGHGTGTNPTWNGKVAGAGETFLIILVAVRGRLTDRPTPAPDLTQLFIDYPGCDDCAIGNVRQQVAYLTDKDLLADVAPGPHDANQLLQPGTVYFTPLDATIPQNENLDDIKLCRFVDIFKNDNKRDCIPLGPLKTSG